MSPAKILPLNEINKREKNGLASKTPSMIDLPEKTPKESQQPSLPTQLTFDDIQKMHYSSLNKAGKQNDEFRPQDFLDLDSGDSDNEILAKFKPEADKNN